jgi:hypothetical protein
MRSLVVLLSLIMVLVGSGLAVWSIANGHTTLFLAAIVPLEIGGAIGLAVYFISESNI